MTVLGVNNGNGYASINAVNSNKAASPSSKVSAAAEHAADFDTLELGSSRREAVAGSSYPSGVSRRTASKAVTQARFDELKTQVQNGTYITDAELIADKMLHLFI